MIYSVHVMHMRPMIASLFFAFFFFNDPATTEIYTLSLHDALPISLDLSHNCAVRGQGRYGAVVGASPGGSVLLGRSEEHTSELQSHVNLVCRLLLEKKKIQHASSEIYYQHHRRPARYP